MESGEDFSQDGKLFIQDSSDEDLHEDHRRAFRQKLSQHRPRLKGKKTPMPQGSKYIIKQEATPRPDDRPFQGIRQLLEPPPKATLEVVEDSGSDSDEQGGLARRDPMQLQRHSQLKTPSVAQKGRQRSTENTDPVEESVDADKDSMRTPMNNLQQGVGSQGQGNPGISVDRPDFLKRQRLGEGTPNAQSSLPNTGEPASVQRSFLASHLPALANVPSSAVRTTPKKGIGPLCHQLQMALKQQEKLVSTQNDAVVKVLTCTPDGPMLQAHCQLVKGMAGRVDLPEKLLMLLKVGPRIDASPGDFISIRKPWQSLEVDGVRVLLVQHADVNC